MTRNSSRHRKSNLTYNSFKLRLKRHLPSAVANFQLTGCANGQVCKVFRRLTGNLTLQSTPLTNVTITNLHLSSIKVMRSTLRNSSKQNLPWLTNKWSQCLISNIFPHNKNSKNVVKKLLRESFIMRWIMRRRTMNSSLILYTDIKLNLLFRLQKKPNVSL